MLGQAPGEQAVQVIRQTSERVVANEPINLLMEIVSIKQHDMTDKDVLVSRDNLIYLEQRTRRRH